MQQQRPKLPSPSLRKDAVHRLANLSKMREILWRIFRKKKTVVQPVRRRLVEVISRKRTDAIASLLDDPLAPVPQSELDAALLLAAALGQLTVCELLLAAGADPAATESPEQHAERQDNVPPAFSPRQAHSQAWLARHTAVGGTALHRAAENNQVDCARLLLERGCGINVADQNGVTALMVACMCQGGQDMVRLLLDSPDCQVNSTEARQGRTPLHFAVQAANPACVQLLIQAGADIDAQDLQQNTPLLLCPGTISAPPGPRAGADPSSSRLRALACMSLLLDANCFVNLFNRDSETALHQAAESRSVEAVQLLVRAGAVVHAEIVRDTCLVLRDDRVLRALLQADHVLHDDFLLTVLIALLVTESSRWMLNSVSEQNRLHLAAKYLLQRVRHLNAVKDFIHQVRPAELENMFGQEFADKFKVSIRTDLQIFGLFGLALKHGKYGVAKMLSTAGCDVTLMQLVKDTEVGDFLTSQSHLLSWLPKVLSAPASLKVLSRSACRSQGLFGPRLPANCPGDLRKYLNLEDLDSIAPFDASVREVEENLLDLSYTGREHAKAAKQQLLWLYS